ncbi:hypothetical protein [uncultured Aquabacterium sp.]|uniref:hypothetical protein n=1 Tax=Aquabacterium sp. TaxID=1872578 RepID=UPI0025D0A174|nr:hypothetical protein [uncultured Aquabacterium sp.]
MSGQGRQQRVDDAQAQRGRGRGAKGVKFGLKARMCIHPPLRHAKKPVSLRRQPEARSTA